MITLVKCSKCGHYHFAITKGDIEIQEEFYVGWIGTLTPEILNKCYGGVVPNAPTYERCFGCGASYTEMIPDDGNCPRGGTLQGIRIECAGSPIGRRQQV